MAKSKEVRFRLNDDELAEAKKIAASYGMTVNAMAKFLVLKLKAPMNKEERQDMKELNRHVGAIGNNLNQIARKLNSNNRLLSSEKMELIATLKEIRNNTLLLIGRNPVEVDKEDIVYKPSTQYKRLFD